MRPFGDVYQIPNAALIQITCHTDVENIITLMFNILLIVIVSNLYQRVK